METRTDSVRSYRTRFQRDEDPISEGGIWLNGARDGIDWADVVVRNGVAYGAVTRMQAAERRIEQGNLASADPGAAPEGDYDDPTALLSGVWGKNQHVKATVFSRKQTEEYFQEVEIRLRSTLTPQDRERLCRDRAVERQNRGFHFAEEANRPAIRGPRW